jgi:uncharacterized surface protein with fasciclin (FAS1) repeats
MEGDKMYKNVWEIISTNPDLEKLKELFMMVDPKVFVEPLKKDDPGMPFTIFAPNNAALEEIAETLKPFYVPPPQGQKMPALSPEGKAMAASIIILHVFPHKWTKEMLVNMIKKDGKGGSEPFLVYFSQIKGIPKQRVPTIFQLKSNGDIYLCGNAKVVQTDLETKNGVVHIIDHVLLPGTCKAVEDKMMK